MRIAAFYQLTHSSPVDDEVRPAEAILAEREKWWQRDWKATMVPPPQDEAKEGEEEEKEEPAAVAEARAALEAAKAVLASLADDATDEEKGEAEDKVSPPGGTPPGEDDPGSEQASQTVRSSMP